MRFDYLVDRIEQDYTDLKNFFTTRICRVQGDFQLVDDSCRYAGFLEFQ